MKTILAIDTASPFCSVALFDGVSPGLSEVSEGEGSHFEQLSGLVARLLAKAGISLADVSALGVGVGPGSFTGIRIGMSYAKGVAWANQVPLLGFCSLAACGAYALDRNQDAKSVAVLSDAGRDELFLGIFERSAQEEGRSGTARVTALFRPAIVPRRDLPTHLASISLVASPQLALLGSEELKEVLPAIIRAIPVLEPALGAWGASDFGVAAGERDNLGVMQLEPVYLRQVAAKTIAERRAEAEAKNTPRN